MKRLVLVLALALLSGCSTFKVTYDAEESSPAVAAPELPLPVRLGVRPRHVSGRLHDVVLAALERDGNFSEVRLFDHRVRDPDAERDVDYVVDLDYQVESDAAGTNFLICFPGFLILAPHWAGLDWNFDLRTSVRLLRPRRPEEVTHLERRDAFQFSYTSPSYLVGCDLGFLGVIFLPMVSSPLISGIVSACDDDQALYYRHRFPRSPRAREWGRRIAAVIAQAIAEDLGQAASK